MKFSFSENKLLYVFIILGALAIISAIAIKLLEPANTERQAEINSFQKCVDADNPVMETYPPKCSTKDGRTFVQDIGNELEKRDLIRVDSPRPNKTIKSPLKMTGEARGTWYHEGVFSVMLKDEDGKIIEPHFAEAQSDWMTEDFVPFKSEFEFETTSTVGTLVFEKANPSGLPENSDRLIIPVKFE